MNRHRLLRGLVSVILFAFGFLGVVIPVSGQSYGVGDQVLTLGGADFHTASSSQTYFFAADGYVYPSGANQYIAPIHLPDGAEVFEICFYANVPTDGSGAQVEIFGSKLAPGGQSGAGMILPGSNLVDLVAIGYGTVCTDPGFSWVFHDETDIDGDDVPDHVAWAAVGNATSNGAGFGGIRILWRRQVSPPPASATFTDVPTTHPFFKYIEALHAAGITAGYADGRFGVNDAISRGQMAVFLSIALGLHWAN